MSLSLYKKTIKHFLKAKSLLYRKQITPKIYHKKEELNLIIDSFLFFIKEFKKTLRGKLNHNTLAEFIFDADYLFPQKNVEIAHKKYGPILKISTDGFLLEFFRALDLGKERKLIKELQDTIDDLQAALELNKEKEIAENKKRLIKILDKLENIIKNKKFSKLNYDEN